MGSTSLSVCYIPLDWKGLRATNTSSNESRWRSMFGRTSCRYD